MKKKEYTDCDGNKYISYTGDKNKVLDIINVITLFTIVPFILIVTIINLIKCIF